jgi:hypothetical protein
MLSQTSILHVYTIIVPVLEPTSMHHDAIRTAPPRGALWNVKPFIYPTQLSSHAPKRRPGVVGETPPLCPAPAPLLQPCDTPLFLLSLCLIETGKNSHPPPTMHHPTTPSPSASFGVWKMFDSIKMEKLARRPFCERKAGRFANRF